MERKKSNNKGRKSDPTTTASVFIDKLTTTTPTTSTPLTTNTSITTTNITKMYEVEKYVATSPKPQKFSRFRRWVDDENQQKQKKNKVWISRGRDSVPRKPDIGINDNKVKKGGNRIDKTKTETQQPRNQELGRFPRVPVESKKDKTSQQSQNRRYREEMEQRRQLQRKRRERKIRRQRQQYEDELRLSENTTPFYDDQHKRRQEGGNHHPPKSNNNNHYASNQDMNRYHYMPKTTFYHNKSSHSKEDEDSFDHQMVFLDLSPDYCNSDKQTGSLGTQGRTCSIDGTDGNCSTLCCGRGYSVRRSVVTERCHCRFQWCCEVKCMKCRREVVEYTCR